MTMKILYCVFAAALVFQGCGSKDSRPESGKLSLNLSCDGDYIIRTRANDDIADFKVTLRREDGWSRSFARFSDIPSVLELGGGVYTVHAASPAALDAAFDQPVYAGSATVTVKVGELSSASVICSLANMEVSFKLTDRFVKELSDYTVTVTNAASWTASDAASRTLVWNKEKIDAGTAGYFSVAPLMVKVDAYRVSDHAEIHEQLRISSVAAKDHHIITLDAQVTGKLGRLSLSIDDSVNEKDVTVTIPGWTETPVEGGGDVPSVPGPSLEWAANPSFSPTPIQDNLNADVVVKVPGKIKTFVVSVDSEVLAPVIAALKGDASYQYAPGRPFEMDLIGDPAMIAALNGLGLDIPTGDALSGKSEVIFPLSGLIPMIRLYDPAPGSNHIFTLKVCDAEEQTLQKSLTFYIP